MEELYICDKCKGVFWEGELDTDKTYTPVKQLDVDLFEYDYVEVRCCPLCSSKRIHETNSEEITAIIQFEIARAQERFAVWEKPEDSKHK